MMLAHLGHPNLAERVDMALEVCGQYERKVRITGRDTGVTGGEYGRYVVETISDPKLKDKWQGYVNAK
jgi:hypothetical protein